MQILITYNRPMLPDTHPESDSEHEIVDVVEAIAGYLDRPEIELRRIGVDRDFEAFRQTLRELVPDIVLNLFEGFGDDPGSESQFARLLEEEGVAFTGESSATISRAGQKHIAKQAFQRAGIATPAWVVVERLPLDVPELPWPVIVKPAFRDASVGIHQANIVAEPARLAEQVERTANEYGLPVLVEEFIEGREVSVAIFDWPELTILPIVETKFAPTNGQWSVDSYSAKWQPESPDHQSKNLQYPAVLAPEALARIEAAARAAYRAVECRGFATVDIRLRDDMPYLLELNPNADMKPSECLIDLLRLVGIEYAEFLQQMIRKARARSKPSEVELPHK